MLEASTAGRFLGDWSFRSPPWVDPNVFGVWGTPMRVCVCVCVCIHLFMNLGCFSFFHPVTVESESQYGSTNMLIRLGDSM